MTLVDLVDRMSAVGAISGAIMVLRALMAKKTGKPGESRIPLASQGVIALIVIVLVMFIYDIPGIRSWIAP